MSYVISQLFEAILSVNERSNTNLNNCLYFNSELYCFNSEAITFHHIPVLTLPDAVIYKYRCIRLHGVVLN